jgi:hypothetical protein
VFPSNPKSGSVYSTITPNQAHTDPVQVLPRCPVGATHPWHVLCPLLLLNSEMVVGGGPGEGPRAEGLLCAGPLAGGLRSCETLQGAETVLTRIDMPTPSHGDARTERRRLRCGQHRHPWARRCERRRRAARREERRGNADEVDLRRGARWEGARPALPRGCLEHRSQKLHPLLASLRVSAAIRSRGSQTWAWAQSTARVI